MDDFGNAGSCQQWRVQIPRRSRRQDDRQVGRELTQRRGEIEREARAGLVAYERGVEARAHGTGLRGFLRPGEADRLITKSRQNFLMTQQASTVGFKHQYRFADAATGCTGCMLNEYRLMRRDRRKPDVETRSGAKGAALPAKRRCVPGRCHAPSQARDRFRQDAS